MKEDKKLENRKEIVVSIQHREEDTYGKKHAKIGTDISSICWFDCDHIIVGKILPSDE
jgi:ribosomal protein S24E